MPVEFSDQDPYKGGLTDTELSKFLTFAIEAITAAGDEAVKGFRSQVATESKTPIDSYDPVTESDRQCESLLRAAIEREWPQHGILGEEYGLKPGNGLTWVMDPIDGTRAFISGFIHWGVLLALYDGLRVRLGVLYQPFLKELFWSGGKSAFYSRDEKFMQLRTSKCELQGEAILCTTDPRLFSDPVERSAYLRVQDKVRLTRYGGDCYQYGLLAMGLVDVVIENQLKPWDIQALIPIIEGAGGCVTDWHGSDASKGGRVVATCGTELHERVLDLLNF